MDEKTVGHPELLTALFNHKIHEVLKVCGELRPTVDIAVV